MPGSRKRRFELTRREFALALAIAVMGFLMSTREWLLWLNDFNPLVGMFIYYGILYGSLLVLSRFGLTVFNVKINTSKQTLGLLLITFSFFLVVDMTSTYVQYVTQGNTQVSNVFLQCEDGAVFWVWQTLLPTAGMEVWRWLTYVISPFFLTLLGCYFVTGKIRIHA